MKHSAKVGTLQHAGPTIRFDSLDYCRIRSLLIWPCRPIARRLVGIVIMALYVVFFGAMIFAAI